jgi:hypothetical protein
MLGVGFRIVFHPQIESRHEVHPVESLSRIEFSSRRSGGNVASGFCRPAEAEHGRRPAVDAGSARSQEYSRVQTGTDKQRAHVEHAVGGIWNKPSRDSAQRHAQ